MSAPGALTASIFRGCPRRDRFVCMLTPAGGRSSVSKLYDTDLDDAVWALVEPQLPAGVTWRTPAYDATCRPSSTRSFYLLRTGRQGRLLPREYSPRSTVDPQFSARGELRVVGPTCNGRCTSKSGWLQVVSSARPSSSWMGQSAKTTERRGTRGFDGHQRVKGRRRQ
jgi:putative transposase